MGVTTIPYYLSLLNASIQAILYTSLPIFSLKANHPLFKTVMVSSTYLFFQGMLRELVHFQSLATVLVILFLFFLLQKDSESDYLLLNFLLVNQIFHSLIRLACFALPLNILQIEGWGLFITFWLLEFGITFSTCRYIRKQGNLFRLFKEIFNDRIFTIPLLCFIGLTILSDFFYQNPDLSYSKVLMGLLAFMAFQLILALLLAFLYYRRKMADQAAESQALRTEDLALYLDRLEDNRDSIRKIRHDLNDLLSLSQLMVRDQDFDHLTDYLDKLSTYVKEEMPQESPSNLADLQQIEDQDLRYLLMSKLLEWEKAGIPYRFECLYPLNTLPINRFDLMRCLAILLNNANEGRQAADPSAGETSDILMLAVDQGLEIQVTNPSPTVAVREAKQAGFSTKAGHRGLGLTNLEEILSAYPNALLNLTYQEGLFQAQLYLTYL